MRTSKSLSAALEQVVDHDERLAGQFPQLAIGVYSAVATGQPFDQPREKLHRALSETLRVHAEMEDFFTRRVDGVSSAVSLLSEAAAAQHRSLATQVTELAQATIGLDVVAITRSLHTTLNLHLDLERRIVAAL